MTILFLTFVLGVAIALVGGGAMWIKAMREMVRQREWGFFLLYLGLLIIIGTAVAAVVIGAITAGIT